MLHRMKVLEKGLGKQCPILLYSDMEVVDEDLYEISPSFAAYTHQDPDRSSFAELLVENQVTGGASMINRALLTHCAMEPEISCMHDWWIAHPALVSLSLCRECFPNIASTEIMYWARRTQAALEK